MKSYEIPNIGTVMEIPNRDFPEFRIFIGHELDWEEYTTIIATFAFNTKAECDAFITGSEFDYDGVLKKPQSDDYRIENYARNLMKGNGK